MSAAVLAGAWRDEALCAQVGGELFFADDPGLARRVCAGCPVAQACLEEAMAAPVDGVWGGTTMRQRRALAAAEGRVYNIHGDHSDLADRERNVGRLHALGYNDQEIAVRLSLAPETAGRIRRRLGLPAIVVESTAPRRRQAAS
jgi:DNA-binding CsgD family transcriptional regulator